MFTAYLNLENRPACPVGAREQANLPAHCHHQFAYDRQADTAALSGGRCSTISLYKRFENALCVFGGNAGPLIGTGDLKDVA